MKRSPLQPGKPISRGQPMSRGSGMKRASKPMKSRGPKMTPIRKSAKGEECTLRFPCCRGERDTVVWCHSNHSVDGKGGGLKARDEEGAYGCHVCHAFLDGGYAGKMPREVVDKFFDLARTESQKILKKKGLMK